MNIGEKNIKLVENTPANCYSNSCILLICKEEFHAALLISFCAGKSFIMEHFYRFVTQYREN